MASNSLVYSNARVKSLENGFLSQDKINRMVFSESLEEAVRVLLESGYGAGTIAEAYDFETILSAEDKKVSEFMAESTVPKMGLETFLMKNDYHNAKAFVKAKYMHNKGDNIVEIHSNIQQWLNLRNWIKVVGAYMWQVISNPPQ